MRGGFAKVWGAHTVSKLGTQLGALSLTALVLLDASASQMGVLAASASAPVVLFAIAAGAWVDRVPRRPVLIASDAGRAALLALVAVGAATGHVSVVHLCAVAAVESVLTLVFDVAVRSYVPGLVGRDGLVEANRRLAGSEAVTEAAAPALGGLAVQVLGAPFALAADAISYALSGALVASVREREAAIEADGDDRPALDGVRAVLKDPLLRALALSTASVSFFGGFFYALYGLFAIRDLRLPVVVVGLLVGAGGVGSFAGSLVAGRMIRRFGIGPVIVASRVYCGVLTFSVPLAGGPPVLAAGMLLVGQLFGDPLFAVGDIGELSLRQAIVPDSLLGRVNAVMHLVDGGLTPVGALVGGWLGTTIGARGALSIAACGMALRGLLLLLSPVRRVRATPSVA